MTRKILTPIVIRIIVVITVNILFFLSVVNATKPLPPFDMDFILEKEIILGGENFITLKFTSLIEAPIKIIANIETSGIVSVAKENSEMEWENVVPKKEMTVQIPIILKEDGEGIIKGSIQGVNEEGFSYGGRSKKIYVLINENGVFTSTISASQLKRDYLEKMFKEGRISQYEYKKSLDKILGGGAIETNNNIDIGKKDNIVNVIKNSLTINKLVIILLIILIIISGLFLYFKTYR